MNLKDYTPRCLLLADSVLAWLVFVTVFISIPSAIYFTNQLDFNYDLSALMPLLSIGCLAFPLLVLAAHGLSEQHRTTIYILLFYIGAFILLKDIFARVEWESLHRDQQPDEPILLTLVELVIALALVILWWKVPVKLLRTFGVPLVLVLFATQAISLVLNTTTSGRTSNRDTDSKSTPAISKPKITIDNPNIYHVVFDGYSALSFNDSAAEFNLSTTLLGFTEFRNNLANYQYTKASVPSFLTGTFFESGSFAEWKDNARTAGIRGALDDAGYTMWMYVPNEVRTWMYTNSDHTRTNYQIAGTMAGSALKLGLLTSVRSAPNFARTEIFWRWNSFVYFVTKTVDLITIKTLSVEDYAYYKHLSTPLIRQFIDDEKTRTKTGNYVYIHVILPHTPYVWDETCSYTLDVENNYGKQTLCATQLMAEIVSTLKSLDRYHGSLIIFQSDHGHEDETRISELPSQIPDHMEMATRSAMELGPDEFKDYLKRLHALLLVKPSARSKQPLYTSHTVTQLADIPVTIAQLAGIEYTSHTARSVFTLEHHEPRAINLFLGEKHKDFMHLSYTSDGKGTVDWKVLGKVTIKPTAD